MRAFRLRCPDLGRAQSGTGGERARMHRVPRTAVLRGPREEGSVAGRGSLDPCLGGWEGSAAASRLRVRACEREQERKALSGMGPRWKVT